MNNDLRPINTIPNFKRFCMTIGELPTSYLETMTYYEMLVWFTEYMKNTIIPTINNNGLAVEELQNKYIELKSYVDNYFTNLDVQQEINNKLDQMAQSGQLTDIIAQYLGLAGMLVFNNVNDMKQATNLVNGSTCQTLGFYSVNDNGGSIYKVRYITNEDIVNNINIIALNNPLLIAELIITNTMYIEQFGAKGDGSDETDIFNKALSLLTINGGTLKLSDKTYYVRTLEILSNITLIGNGYNSIIKGHGNASNTENRILKMFSRNNNIIIKNLCVDVNSSERTNITDSDIAISITGSNNIEVENVKIIGGDKGSYCLRVGQHNNIRPKNIVIHNCDINAITGGFNGIAVTCGENVTIENNVINNTLGTGQCIDVEANTPPESDYTLDGYKLFNVYINNNKLIGSGIGVIGVNNPNNKNFIVSNNIIEFTPLETGETEAIKIYQSQDVDVYDNVIVYNNQYANNTETKYSPFRINGNNINIDNNIIKILSTCYTSFRIYGTSTNNVNLTNNKIYTENITVHDLINCIMHGKIAINDNKYYGTVTGSYGLYFSIGSSATRDNELIFANNMFTIEGRGLYITGIKSAVITNNIIHCYRLNLNYIDELILTNNIIHKTTGSYNLFESNLYENNTNVTYDNNITYGNSANEYTNKPQMNRYTQAPQSGYWKKGTIVWHSNPTKGSKIGWVCIETGTPGTWLPIATLPSE